MKKIFIFIVLLITLSITSSCNKSNDNSNNSNIEEHQESSKKDPTHYEITLDMNNYLDYLNVDYTQEMLHNQYYNYIKFEGALNHAIYDDCIVGYQFKDTDEIKYITLNKGGFGRTESSFHHKVVIISISGKVSYLI